MTPSPPARAVLASLLLAALPASALVPGPSLPSMPTMPSLPGTSGPARAPGPNPVMADSAARRIPLQPGLVVTTVRTTPAGDEETSKRITAADRDSVTVAYRAHRAGEIVQATRVVRREDLANATSLRHAFTGGADERFDGTTALGVSARVLGDLKDTGSSGLTLDVGGLAQGAGVESAGLEAELDAMLGEVGGFEGIEEAVRRQADRGTITEGERAQGAQSLGDIRRLGLATGRLRITGSEDFAVVVNDRPVRVKAIRAIGSLSNGKDEFQVALAVLDDPGNPLLLRLEVDGEAMQVVRLAYAQSSIVFALQIERALTERCQVDAYGLTFAPGAATLDPEADETLQALRIALGRHDDWTLAVLSHGDGTTAASLSRQRAKAVQAALSQDGGARLVAVDVPRPAWLATNDTLGGRALNRRITLSRTGCR